MSLTRRAVVAGLAVIAATSEIAAASPQAENNCADLAIAAPSVTEAGERPRIRPYDLTVARLLLSGLVHSVTLRTIVDDLQTRNVVVYLVLRPDLPDAIGSLEWITSSGDLRFVRASISARLRTVERISAIGHELQHAMEVAQATKVRDVRTYAELFERVGQRALNHGWETEKAFAVGRQVHRDLTSSPAGNIDGVRLRMPLDWLRVYRCERASAVHVAER